MSDTLLYTLSVSESCRTDSEQSQQREVRSEGSVTSKGSGGRPVAANAETQTLRLAYKGYNAKLIADMMKELAGNNDGLDILPWYGYQGGQRVSTPSIDGYYAVEESRRGDADPRVEGLPTARPVLRRRGSRNTVWRILEIEQTGADIDRFGSDGNMTQEAHVAIPAAASKVRWYDGESQTEVAPVDGSRDGVREYGSVNVYNLDSCSFDPKGLIYDCPYEAEGPVDVEVWDTNGYADKTTTITVQGEDRNVLEWQRVFDPGHEFQDEAVYLSNGHVRIYLDEATGGYRLDTYNGSVNDGMWFNGPGSQDDDWQVLDVNLLFIGAARVSARVLWEHPTDGSTYPLRVDLRRANTYPQWYKSPENGQQMPSIPDGLYNLLKSQTMTSAARLVTKTSVIDRGDVD